MVKFILADKLAKPLDEGEVATMLSGPHILRLGFIDERDGWPVVHPVWFNYENEMFLISTDTQGAKARSLRKNSETYFVVDVDDRPPRGVRGKGSASISDDHDYATEVTKKCVVKYLGTTETESAKKIIEMGRHSSVIEIIPHYIATWKF